LKKEEEKQRGVKEMMERKTHMLEPSWNTWRRRYPTYTGGTTLHGWTKMLNWP